MANVNFVAIRKRIREVLDEGLGNVRTVAAGRVSGDYVSGAPAWHGTYRTLSTPRFTIPAIEIEKSTASPLEPGSLRIYLIWPTIECEYDLADVVDTDDNRDAAVAQAETDADIFDQALSWPGQLTTTSGGTSTGIIDGVLSRDGAMQVVTEDWQARRLITRHRFRGHVNVTLATS